MQAQSWVASYWRGGCHSMGPAHLRAALSLVSGGICPGIVNAVSVMVDRNALNKIKNNLRQNDYLDSVAR